MKTQKAPKPASPRLSIDHRLEIRYQVNADNSVVAQVWSVTLSDERESLRFASAPSLTKSDATTCALIYIREAWVRQEESTASPYRALSDQTTQLKTELQQTKEAFELQSSTVRNLQSELCELRQDSASGLDARIKLQNALAVLETVLQHCEGKGWRSTDVAALVKGTIDSVHGGTTLVSILVGALKQTRTELSHWHNWKINHSPDYRNSDGFAICNAVLNKAEHAINAATL